MDNDELFCKIYVDTDREEVWLLQVIASHLKGRIEGRTIESDLIAVDVSENEDFDPAKRESDDDFVFFRYYLDVVSGKGAQRPGYVTAVSSILVLLWGLECRAVAACDFEDELPNRGGYHSK